MNDIDKLGERVFRICEEKDWTIKARGILGSGCYLHLEASEMIEAMRGKGDEHPLDEGADVLFCLLAMCWELGCKPSELFARLDRVLNEKFGPSAGKVPG